MNLTANTARAIPRTGKGWRILLWCSLVLPMLAGGAAAAELTDAQSPRPGASLFDRLFSVGAEGQLDDPIPYPFANLLTVLEKQLGLSINGDPNRVNTVRIPLGRCINRYAGAPEYFRFPRIVAAVDSQHYGRDFRNVELLRDRIFLGFQEKAGIIDVISYNDEAGRFEFQQVTNYLAGERPQVRYPDRESCVVCHQNQGPIFPQALWDETGNNREIYDLLADASPATGGEPPRYRVSEAANIDASTNRANLFPLYQAFWKDACRSADSDASRLCRAGLLQLALENRLQESNRVLLPSDLVTKYLQPLSGKNVSALWPGGITVPSSDIDNRNPMRGSIEAHLASAEELKFPRTLSINWQPGNMFRIVEGLGQMISLNDIRQLDRLLYNYTSTGANLALALEGSCTLRRMDPASSEQLGFGDRSGEIAVRCNLSEGAVSSRYSFMGGFAFENREVLDKPVFNRLVLGGPSVILGLTHLGGQIEILGNQFVLKLPLRDSRHRLYARLPGMGIVRDIEIRWDAGSELDNVVTGARSVAGRARISILPDQQVLENVLADLALSRHGELFAYRPFNGETLMSALFARL